MVDTVTVGSLPKDLTDGVVRELSTFNVGFTRVTALSNRPEVSLLGSGTLVTVAGKQAILTAHHVVKVLPRTGRLGLLLWSSDHPLTLDTAGLGFVEIARGSEDSVGPDLGAVVLSAPIASSISAQKSFYNLDLRRQTMLHSPLPVDVGFWTTNGFVDERTSEEQHPSLYIKRFFNLCAAGGVESLPDVGSYDYFSCPVSLDGRAQSPQSFGGMSGGGLWQVPLARDASGSLVSKTPLLSGVVFYQVATTDTECGVRCHGRRSVYQVAYDAIRGAL